MIDKEKIKLAEKCLIDNGISEDEAATVLQAIGYTLLDEELYPEGNDDPDMKIWSVPVHWQASGNYFVKAKTFADAAHYIEGAEDVPLPGNQLLIDSTFCIDYDGATLFNGANGSTEPIDDIIYLAH